MKKRWKSHQWIWIMIVLAGMLASSWAPSAIGQSTNPEDKDLPFKSYLPIILNNGAVPPPNQLLVNDLRFAQDGTGAGIGFEFRVFFVISNPAASPSQPAQAILTAQGASPASQVIVIPAIAAGGSQSYEIPGFRLAAEGEAFITVAIQGGSSLSAVYRFLLPRDTAQMHVDAHFSASLAVTLQTGFELLLGQDQLNVNGAMNVKCNTGYRVDLIPLPANGKGASQPSQMAVGDVSTQVQDIGKTFVMRPYRDFSPPLASLPLKNTRLTIIVHAYTTF